jgi:hypothetical protein
MKLPDIVFIIILAILIIFCCYLIVVAEPTTGKELTTYIAIALLKCEDGIQQIV